MSVEQGKKSKEKPERKPEGLIPRDKIGGNQTGGGPKSGLGQDMD